MAVKNKFIIGDSLELMTPRACDIYIGVDGESQPERIEDAKGIHRFSFLFRKRLILSMVY